jgi:hypothetical protein
MNAQTKRRMAAALWVPSLALLVLIAIQIHRSVLHGTKEEEQLYLMGGMLLAPIVPMGCLRVRLLGSVFVAFCALVLWHAFATGFFYYMDHHGTLSAESCVGTSVDFDETRCRGHYGFENELLVPHLWTAGLLGTLIGLGGRLMFRRGWAVQ